MFRATLGTKEVYGNDVNYLSQYAEAGWDIDEYVVGFGWVAVL